MSISSPSATEKLARAGLQLHFAPRAFGLAWKAARGWTALWLALLLAQGVLPAAVVYLTRELVNGLAGVVAAGGLESPALTPTLVAAATIGLLLLLGEALHGAADWVRAAQARHVEDHLSGLIHAKSTQVDLAFYESPEYHDHLHRARAEATYRPVALLENAGNLLQNGVTLAAMAAVLLPYGWWVPVALLLSTLPAFAVVVRFAIRQHRWRQSVTADERRASYHDWLMTTGEAAAEIRLFGLAPHFRAAFSQIRSRLRGEELRLARQQGVAELIAAALALLVAAACVAWMGWRAIQGQATLGDLALFYQAFSMGQRLMRSVLGSIGHVYYNVLFLGNLFAFLDLEAKIAEPASPHALAATPAGLGIRYRDVSFTYPGATRVALEGLDLEIAPGQIIAIVGTNGAGKSTLLKLLCRFYDPQSGSVELNGVDVRDLPLDEVRSLVTVLFQEPVRYNATVAENIALHPALARATRADIEAAARAAGCEEMIARLPRGYETLLGKWFDGGIELSTGEWQRIALARAFMRRAPVILLDEPTAAMDSWAEADWLKRFRALADGRTAMVVTHRFTTAMRADVIYVMNEGRIREFGTHAQLLARDGDYARSWRAQMRAENGAPLQ
ncbi:MAG: ABC transporter ATP-binding protein [Usitatibacter sp.]